MANIRLEENINPDTILSGTGKQISHPNSWPIGLIGEKNIPSRARANKTNQIFPVNATAIHPTLTKKYIYLIKITENGHNKTQNERPFIV